MSGASATSNCTVLSALVDAVDGLFAASNATPAASDAVTVPLWVIPDTDTLYTVVDNGVTSAAVAPADPPNVTSPVAKPVTGSENVTVNRIGDADVGST